MSLDNITVNFEKWSPVSSSCSASSLLDFQLNFFAKLRASLISCVVCAIECRPLLVLLHRLHYERIFLSSSYLLFDFSWSFNDPVDVFFFCFALLDLRVGLESRSSVEGTSDSREFFFES